MGCVQSKPSKRQGLFKQQEEIISQGKQEEEIINKQQGNNNKDDSEKVRRSERCQQINFLFVLLLLTIFVVFDGGNTNTQLPHVSALLFKGNVLLQYQEMLFPTKHKSSTINFKCVTSYQHWKGHRTNMRALFLR